MKAIRLFSMQGMKVNNSRRTVRGPNKVDMGVVNQGEELNQDSNLLQGLYNPTLVGL